MISDLVDAAVIEALVARTSASLSTELERLSEGDQVARAGAQTAGTTEREARDAKAALDEWLQMNAATNLLGDGPVKLPRSALPSILQSEYEEFFRDQEMTAPQKNVQGLSGSQVPATSETLDADAREFLLGKRDYLGGRWFTRFAERDLRFLTWGAAAKLATRITGGKRRFTKQPPAPVKFANRARLILVGDWGSGVPRAVQLGAVMRKSVLEGADQQREVHVIHLGDVYYTGQRKEYTRRLLDPWPVKPGEENRFGSWCLNGNHDMYSGGYDYFDHLLVDPRFKRHEQSSYFCLENDYWQIMGLDSAWDDADLCDPQAEWVERTRKRAPNKGGTLLSHHQLFSAWEHDSPSMAAKIKPVLDQKLIKAWFWGHEHRCALYDDRAGVAYRLIGHGGVPVWAPTKPTPAGVAYEFRESFPAFIDEEFARFGFAQLDFDDKTIAVSYIKEQGWAHKTETIVV